jgi:hypothetical protein
MLKEQKHRTLSRREKLFFDHAIGDTSGRSGKGSRINFTAVGFNDPAARLT